MSRKFNKYNYESLIRTKWFSVNQEVNGTKIKAHGDARKARFEYLACWKIEQRAMAGYGE